MSAEGVHSVVTVRSPVFTYGDLLIQATMFLIVGPVGAMVWLFATPGGLSLQVVLLKLGFWAVLLVVMDVMLEAMTHVRRIDVETRGVTFYYLFSKEFGAWNTLSPSDYPSRHGMYAFKGVRSDGGQRAYTVTNRQARAILSHPSRPAWEGGSDVLQTINQADPGPNER